MAMLRALLLWQKATAFAIKYLDGHYIKLFIEHCQELHSRFSFVFTTYTIIVFVKEDFGWRHKTVAILADARMSQVGRSFDWSNVN